MTGGWTAGWPGASGAGSEAFSLFLAAAGVLLIAELAFYVLYWRPRRAAWNAQPVAPHAPTHFDAADLFRRFVAHCEAGPGRPNLEKYLSLWFQGEPCHRICRGNMEELMAYGFWYRTPAEMEAAGLGHVPGEMVDKLERIWQHTFPPGYTEGVKFMSHIWDDLRVQYRPLAFYLAMEGAAAATWATLRLLGFRCHQIGSITYYTRGMRAGTGSSITNNSTSSSPASTPRSGASTPASTTSTSSSSAQNAAPAPVLFLHGVGGMVIYLDLIRQIAALGGPVIAVDVRHVGMRLSPRIPCVDEMTSEILAILDAEGVGKACVVGHSYGTLIASRLVKRFPARLHSLCLIDPVCFGMYMPHLLHNFFYRRLVIDVTKPLQTFLDLIVHFASRDIHLSTAFSRRFFWSDVIMWPEELPHGSTVVLGAADDLVHADEIHALVQQVCGSTVISLLNPGVFHGGFLVLPSVTRRVVTAISAAARGRACDSHLLAEAAAHEAAACGEVLAAPRDGTSEAVVVARVETEVQAIQQEIMQQDAAAGEDQQAAVVHHPQLRQRRPPQRALRRVWDSADSDADNASDTDAPRDARAAPALAAATGGNAAAIAAESSSTPVLPPKRRAVSCVSPVQQGAAAPALTRLASLGGGSMGGSAGAAGPEEDAQALARELKAMLHSGGSGSARLRLAAGPGAALAASGCCLDGGEADLPSPNAGKRRGVTVMALAI